MQFTKLVSLLPLLLTPASAFINVNLFAGTNCGGTKWDGYRAALSCTQLPLNIASGWTQINSNFHCLYVYYGANCEDHTLVSIQDGWAPCGNYWGTVRSAKTATCPGKG